MNITSSRRTVRLGSILGVYERFLIRNLIRYLQLHRQECTAEGHSSVLYGVTPIYWGAGSTKLEYLVTTKWDIQV